MFISAVLSNLFHIVADMENDAIFSVSSGKWMSLSVHRPTLRLWPGPSSPGYATD